MGGRTRNSTPARKNGGAKATGVAANTAKPPTAAEIAEAEATKITAAKLAELLAEAWPAARVELDHDNAYQLLVATILAAQSTDKTINTITPAVFVRYPDPNALAQADPSELEKLIVKSGFFRNKAKHLIGMAQAVVARHGGEIPRTMEELCGLPGVARKTANVVLGSALGLDVGVVVDTHVTRLAARLGLTTHTDPVKIEHDLMAILPQEQWTPFAHRLIWHGRRVCIARKPDCEHCTLAPLCPSAFAPVQPKDASPRAQWNAQQRAARKGAAAVVATTKLKDKAKRAATAAAIVKPNRSMTKPGPNATARGKLPAQGARSAARAKSKPVSTAQSSTTRSSASRPTAGPSTARSTTARSSAARSGTTEQ